PEDLGHVILKCMEKDKERRYQSAGKVQSELERIEKGIPTTEREIPKRKPITSKEITVTFGLKKLFIPALVVVAVIIATIAIWQLLSKKEGAPIPSDKLSIAVLPFEDLSPQKDQEILCDGMADEIIAKLSRLQGWKVMNRNSVMLYKNTGKDIKEIGQELDVVTILLGSVRKEEDDIRVTAQLVNVEDRFQIWSDIYNQKLERIFDIQSDIAEKIAEALRAKLSPEAGEQLQKKPTENLEAYKLYLQGRYFWNKRTEEDLKKAIEYFEQAIEKDPNYALAYVGLADSYLVLPDYSSFPRKEATLKAEKATRKALEIDNTLGEAHASLASIEWENWDWGGAEKEFKRAIELNPGYATAHHWYAFLLMFEGRHDESIREIKLAKDLDPLSLIINANVGFMLHYARRYDEALEHYMNVIEIAPDLAWLHRYIGMAYEQKEMHKEAEKEFQRAITLSGGFTKDLEALAHTYAMAGKREEAIEIVGELRELFKRERASPYGIASIYAALGEKDKAFEWLEKAYEIIDSKIPYLKVDPLFDNIRTDPRFKVLLKKVGFE
ncbi:MAG: tetratricopeptide repeat protein, partial [Candidatus Aminicenantes bacterium]|nr:tetratricopeptide repeat protein [Candidatus Aminicenantes bacterium]